MRPKHGEKPVQTHHVPPSDGKESQKTLVSKGGELKSGGTGGMVKKNCVREQWNNVSEL